MRRFYFALIGASMMAACGQKKPQQVALGDSASRDIKLTVPDSTVPLNDAPSTRRPTRSTPSICRRPRRPRSCPQAEADTPDLPADAVNTSFDAAESAGA